MNMNCIAFSEFILQFLQNDIQTSSSLLAYKDKQTEGMRLSINPTCVFILVRRIITPPTVSRLVGWNWWNRWNR